MTTTPDPVDLDTPMNREDAEKLDKRIRNLAGATGEHLDNLGALISEAKAGQIHEALEFGSWTAYLADALKPLTTDLSREDRREVVAYLYEAGMSVRTIAAATGTPKSTISDDLHVSGNRTPDVEGKVLSMPISTTGKDGKNYARSGEPQPSEPQPNKIHNTVTNLLRATRSIEKLAGDDENRAKLACRIDELKYSSTTLQAVIKQLRTQGQG